MNQHSPMQDKDLNVSIVILSWNDKRFLRECLDSLSNTATSRPMEIIVVDNASSDGSPEMVEAEFPSVRLVRNRENLGFPKGNNIGVQMSRGKYVCLLNSDIRVIDGCLEALTDYMESQPGIGMVGPRILNSDGTHQSSCRRFPSFWNNLCEAVGLASTFRGSRLVSGEHMFYFKGDRLLDVDVLVGCFWMARREAIDQFGLLDEGFFMYAEDVDWCKRCWEAGWRVVFFPGASAIHHRGGSSSKKDPVWLALTQQRSVLRYWKKHHGTPGLLSARSVLSLHRIVRGGAALISYLTRPVKREESETRLRVARACLRELLSSAGTGRA